jgi:hypothetical protein
MSYGAEAAAAAEMIANAVKASGVIVQVDAENFLAIVNWNDQPLVVHATGGFFSIKHQYLTSYRGLAFYAKIAEPLPLPPHAQLVEANKIWIPG